MIKSRLGTVFLIVHSSYSRWSADNPPDRPAQHVSAIVWQAVSLSKSIMSMLLVIHSSSLNLTEDLHRTTPDWKLQLKQISIYSRVSRNDIMPLCHPDLITASTAWQEVCVRGARVLYWVLNISIRFSVKASSTDECRDPLSAHQQSLLRRDCLKPEYLPCVCISFMFSV